MHGILPLSADILGATITTESRLEQVWKGEISRDFCDASAYVKFHISVRALTTAACVTLQQPKRMKMKVKKYFFCLI
jgi:hypothetical protein